MNPSRRAALVALAGSVALGMPALRTMARSGPDLPASTTDLAWIDGSSAHLAFAYNLRTARTPAYRALCRTEAAAATALRWARSHDMPFAIASGGHCFEGLSQSPHLVIDLGPLDAVAVTKDAMLVAGPGAKLGKVNRAAALHGLALPAGYCQGVALGGHVGGGGIGILSRRFGLTCDNLLSARVLLADGNVVTASMEEHPDLFWALHGGGSGSFGIVTSWSLRLHDPGPASFGELSWLLPLADAARIIAGFQHAATAFPPELHAVLYVGIRSPGTVLLRLRLVATGVSGAIGPAAASLGRLAPTLVEPTLLAGDFAAAADWMWPPAHNPVGSIKSASNYLPAEPDVTVLTSVLEAMSAGYAHVPTFNLETLGGAIDLPDPGATAYPHRGKPFMAQFSVTIPPNAVQTAPRATLRAMQTAWSALALSGTYVNYPDRDLPDWQAEYWGAGTLRLSSVKRQYDPSNIFFHPHSVRP